MKYRRDSRSEKEFADDIKSCHEIETDLMCLYVDWLNKNKPSLTYDFVDNGVDNSGELIKDDKQVTADADFKLIKTTPDGVIERLIEIKFCRKDYHKFHLKVAQMNKYIEDDVCIVMWMGIDTQNRRFCILTPKKMQELLDTIKPVKMWHKWCLPIKNELCEWHPYV